MKRYIILYLYLAWIFGIHAQTYQSPLNTGTKNASFTYSNTQNTSGLSNSYGRSTNEAVYTFTLGVPMEVVASHCGSALSDTYMHLLDASKNLIVSNDDYSGKGRCTSIYHSYIKRQLATGTYYIVSEGYSDSGNITTTITGTVIVYVTGASLNTANLSLNINATSRLTATVAPANATNQAVSWTSSNNTVATVSNTDLITAKSRGTATITVTTVDGNRTATCTVTVTGKLAPVTAVPSTSQNYIKTRTYTSADGVYYMDAVQYYNGLGRPSQTVQTGITPSQSDFVALQTYDGFGREDRAWLSAIASGNRGAFVTDFTTRSGNTYNNTAYNHTADANPYSYPVYEPSPLNRVVQQYGPGANWHNNGKSVKTGYLTNSSAYLYAYYYVSGNNLFRNGNYNGSQLYVMQITDEEGNISYEFKDKWDRVVLQRQMDGSNKHDTYYVYDDFGNLRYVLPPLAADGTGNGSYDESSTIIKNYVYVYKYDERNRRIWKQLPGCSPVCYVYDRTDRLIFSQDGEQQARNEWIFNKYDAFGRIILSGIYTDSRTQSQLTEAFRNTLVVEYPTGGNYGYSWNVQPVVSPDKVLTVNHYDNYQHLPDQSSDFNNNLNYETRQGFGTRYVNTACTACSTKGLLVGTRVKLTDGSGKIVTAMYYDEKGRLVQKKSTNHLGGFDKEFYAYSFTGQVEKREHVHSGQGTNITETYRYEYDHAERLTDTYYQVSGQPEYLLSHHTYDEPGRLKTTTPCNLDNFKSTYSYDIRSLIRSIGSSNYTEGLTYKYNGNVATMQWAQAGTTRQYTFGYDGLSRLKTTSITGDIFPTSYLYDKNGNFSQIIRFGLIKEGGNVSKTIDCLTFQYRGNRIRSIGDGTAPVLQNTVYDFKKYAGTLPVVSDTYVAGNKLVSDSMHIVGGWVSDSIYVDNTRIVKYALIDEYSYNANGSVTRDLNKGISEIAYNVLNLPSKIDIKSPVAEARNEYTYSADGRKLKTVHKWASSYSTTPVIGSAINVSNLNNTKTTDYAGNFIYENGSLKRILTENGYYEGGIHYFYVKNHLGSNVMTVNRNGSIVQHNHYYPFGLRMGISNNQGLQPYKYTGKELDMEHGLMLYDYGARQYDPAMGRFLTIDPMAERYYAVSPYVYCNNNPIRYIDPTGLAWRPTFDEDQEGKRTYNGYEWIPEDRSKK